VAVIHNFHQIISVGRFQGLAKLTAEHRRDLLEILEDRYGARSTLVTSQFPVEKWHDVIGDPTLADAILDRLVHQRLQDRSKRSINAQTQSRIDAANTTRVTTHKPRAATLRWVAALHRSGCQVSVEYANCTSNFL
jgi:hypothetical protein